MWVYGAPDGSNWWVGSHLLRPSVSLAAFSILAMTIATVTLHNHHFDDPLMTREGSTNVTIVNVNVNVTIVNVNVNVTIVNIGDIA